MRRFTTERILTILLAGCLIHGCSIKEFRSPIVFRSPVVMETPEAPESAPPPAPVSPPRGPAMTAAPSSPAATPAGITVYPDAALQNLAYEVLGTIHVSSPAPPGFSREQAVRELQVKAFSRYGDLAQGLCRIRCPGEDRPPTEKAPCREITGDVIMLGTARKQPEQQTGDSLIAAALPPSTDHIGLFTAEDLLHRNFGILGTVSVSRPRSGKGFTREEALSALKNQALKTYGHRAKGLTNIELVSMPRIFFYTKVRKNISPPADQGTFEKGSAEVVIWREK